MAKRRASRAEREQRTSELGELLAARTPAAVAVRYAVKKWGLGERAAQKYVAEARAQLRAGAAIDRSEQLGLVLAGYELILRRQLTGGDLRGARATLDKLVLLLGLALPAGERPLSLAAIDAEIARLEAELAELEGRSP